MSDRPIGLGKVAENGTLNENGAFYSVQDINVLLENGGGSSGGDLPTPTIADAGKAVVVGDDGSYELGEAGGGEILIVNITGDPLDTQTLAKSYKDIADAISADKVVIFKAASPVGYSFMELSSIMINDQDESPYLVYLYSEFEGTIIEYEFKSETETGVLTCMQHG